MKNYFYLHIMLFFLSLSGILSKLAAGETFLSVRFCLLYGGMLVILGVYALCWQQIIKRLPLSVAYANKAVCIVWGMLWGVLFFGEKISPNMIVGGIIVICGVLVYVREDKSSNEK